MMTSLDPDLQSVVDLATGNVGHGGSLRGLIALLRHEDDYETVAGAVSQIGEPDPYDAETRRAVADLLASKGGSVLAARWRPAPQRVTVGGRVRDAENRQFAPAGQKIGFDDIGGLHGVKKRIRRRIIDPFRNEGLFKQFRRKTGGGVLLYGPPGCGKTMLARALAHECGAEFIAIHPADIIDCHWGESEKALQRVFAEARHMRPTVLFFDEVEAIAQRRNYSGHNNFLSTMVSTLLTEMDGFEGNNEGLLFLGATNVPWAVDPAFRRTGRFDRTIFVPPPDREAREVILRDLLKERPIARGLSLPTVVEATGGYSGADLAGLVETAVDFAIDESLDGARLAPLSTGHFREALEDMSPSTGEWLAEARSYADFANGERLYDDLAKFLRKHAR